MKRRLATLAGEREASRVIDPRDPLTLHFVERHDVAYGRSNAVVDTAGNRIGREDVDLCIGPHREMTRIRRE